MSTNLPHDYAFLKRLVTEAIRLHKPKSVEEARMLADIRDYLMYLCLDAFEDPALAKQLAAAYAQLQNWLEERRQVSAWKRTEAETIRFYTGFLFALE